MIYKSLPPWHAKCIYNGTMKTQSYLPALFTNFDNLLRVLSPECECKCEGTKNFEFTVHLAGFRKQDVKLEVYPQVLSIVAEREGHDSFSQDYFVPQEFDLSQTTASMEEGLLKVSVPRLAVQPAKVIAVS